MGHYSALKVTHNRNHSRGINIWKLEGWFLEMEFELKLKRPIDYGRRIEEARSWKGKGHGC